MPPPAVGERPALEEDPVVEKSAPPEEATEKAQAEAQAKAEEEAKAKMIEEKRQKIEMLRASSKPIVKSEEAGCIVWEVHLEKRQDSDRFGFSHLNGQEALQIFCHDFFGDVLWRLTRGKRQLSWT